MPRGQHPNSLKALEENRKKTEFNSKTASKARKKGISKEAATRKLLDAVANGMEPDKAAARFIHLLEAGNMKAWKLWLEYTAVKPAADININTSDKSKLDELLEQRKQRRDEA